MTLNQLGGQEIKKKTKVLLQKIINFEGTSQRKKNNCIRYPSGDQECTALLQRYENAMPVPNGPVISVHISNYLIIYSRSKI